ncbi:FAD/NAD(P)-binding protein [Agrobacterium larrymoorei]|uniref:FAD/NAD(P)-binding protein n=1 Tax=Agrobacterium larrymoorei TaxID=160699 RepID=UPI0030C22994
MKNRICIIGSGPTGIYTLKTLIESPTPLDITIYEAESEAGKGTPYLPGINDPVMLCNIPSIEIPLIGETLTDWLKQQPDAYLQRFGIVKSEINERQFYPRVMLGDYFHTQFQFLLNTAGERGHIVTVKPGHRVCDIVVGPGAIQVKTENAEKLGSAFGHVVMATGHDWPETTEKKPGYFVSPWPATALEGIRGGSLGILGTSLSAIDALMTVSTSNGSFIYDEAGALTYKPASEAGDFHATLMSRKGLLPEADFYFPIPYETPSICTEDAIDALIAEGPTGLLDAAFELFRQELSLRDPDYAMQIGLSELDVDSFAEAYYAYRSGTDPFAWAALNLAEAKSNMAQEITVPWRNAIMITHEIIARIVPHLDMKDFKRFGKSFKSIFIDEYATVPHLSIERLLALRNAGVLSIQKLGNDYEIATTPGRRGVIVKMGDKTLEFDTFIDATGQSAHSAKDIPFPSLISGDVVRQAPTVLESNAFSDGGDREFAHLGGIDVDEDYRVISGGALHTALYCAAIPYLLHKHPFIQGITSAAEIGEVVAVSIIKDLTKIDLHERLTA